MHGKYAYIYDSLSQCESACGHVKLASKFMHVTIVSIPRTNVINQIV
jgi:hypothetical protein